MDRCQTKWSIPRKGYTKGSSSLVKNSQLYKTPVKLNDNKSKQNICQNVTNYCAMLENHCTPPSGVTKFIAENPFEAALTSRLHVSVISPTVFSKVSTTQDSPDFKWNVEELALRPANIDEFPVQESHCIDPDIEMKAQAAIDKFFSTKEIIPSPWITNKKERKIKSDVDTVDQLANELDINNTSSKSIKDGSSQTVLSFPPELPQNVEEILKPYTFTQEEIVDSDDANLSNSSLRRKLFHNHYNYVEQDNESSMSPIKLNNSLLSSSPPISGMLIYGTPLKKLSQKMQRYHGTPNETSENLSPLNLSPINNTNDTSNENFKNHSRSIIRLDFSSDVDVDTNNKDNMEVPQINGISDVSALKILDEETSESINAFDDCNKMKPIKYTKNDTTIKDTVSITKTNEESETMKDCNHDVINRLQFINNTCKFYINQNNISQQNASNVIHDTGYQTYSINNMINTIGDFCTPMKQKINLN